MMNNEIKMVALSDDELEDVVGGSFHKKLCKAGNKIGNFIVDWVLPFFK